MDRSWMNAAASVMALGLLAAGDAGARRPRQPRTEYEPPIRQPSNRKAVLLAKAFKRQQRARYQENPHV